jgi:MerR family mercuric resistance operon transcriptional regulator
MARGRRESVRVGAAAEAAGVHVQTLHYYERRGLVAPRGRSSAGYREYGPEQVSRVRAIKRAQALGFTLDEIGELIGLAEAGRPSRRVGELAARKLEGIEEKIRDLRRVQRALRAVVESCRCGGDLSDCRVLDGLS